MRESDPSIGHASSMSSADAGRLRLGDVDDDDVGQLLVGDRARDRRADVAGAAYHCHFSVHQCASMGDCQIAEAASIARDSLTLACYGSSHELRRSASSLAMLAVLAALHVRDDGVGELQTS